MTKLATTLIAGALGTVLTFGALPAAAANDFQTATPIAAAYVVTGDAAQTAEIVEVKFGHKKGFRKGFGKFRGGKRGFIKKGFFAKKFKGGVHHDDHGHHGKVIKKGHGKKVFKPFFFN